MDFEINIEGLLFSLLGLAFSVLFLMILLSWSVRLGAKFNPRLSRLLIVIAILYLAKLALELLLAAIPTATLAYPFNSILSALVLFLAVAFVMQWVVISRERPDAHWTTKYKVAGVYIGLIGLFIGGFALLDYFLRPMLYQ